MTTTQPLPFVAQIDTLINNLDTDSVKKDPILLDMIEGVINEAIIESGLLDLEVLLHETYEPYVRETSRSIMKALLDVEEECVDLVIENDEFVLFGDDEVTGVYDSIPVEVEVEVTLKSAVA